MTRPATLAGWLAYVETLHPKAIAMGLDRVAAVAQRTTIAISCPVITVAGTNGKGSTCAILEAIRRAFPCPRLRVADRGLREGMLVQMMREDGVWQ